MFLKITKRALLVVLFTTLVFVTSSCGQSKSNYKISWDPDPSGKTASWNVYLEQRTTSSGFVLKPGANRYNTDITQFVSIVNIPGNTTEAIIELNNDGQWIVVGVEAMSSSGVYSDFGLNTTPYKKGDAPPVPGGVMIQRLP